MSNVQAQQIDIPQLPLKVTQRTELHMGFDIMKHEGRGWLGCKFAMIQLKSSGWIRTIAMANVLLMCK